MVLLICYFFLESAAYASCQENIICHSWPRWWENICDEKIFGYVCSPPDSSTGYKFYALKSGNVRGTKEIICFINWITGNVEANCRRHPCELIMNSQFSGNS